MHRCARRDAVVDEDDGPSPELGRRPAAAIGGFPPCKLGALTVAHGLERGFVAGEPVEEVIVVYGDAAERYGADGELGIERRAELAHDEHVERRAEHCCHFGGDRHAATRQPEDDDVALETLATQALGQLPAGLDAVAETRTAAPVKHVDSLTVYFALAGRTAIAAGTYSFENRVHGSTNNGAASRPPADSAAIVADLRRPGAWPGEGRIEVVETHFAWVFLGERHAYKLKKPLRFHQVDFSTLEARREGCELEIELNQRLAAATYIAAVPLYRAAGHFVLEGGDEPVEWLVKMRRLPEERTLEQTARARAERPDELAAVIDKLAAFYAATTRAPWDGAAYVAHLVRQQREWAVSIARAAGRAPTALDALAAAQSRAIEQHEPALAARVEAGRVLDAHGDLRPEHVFLLPDPQIIDCLEFARDLRLLDTAEELAFLDLECERLGRPDLGRSLVEGYRRRLHDAVGPALFGFYRSRRALARALISQWNLVDASTAERARHWRACRDWYLNAGLAAVRGAHGRG